MIALEIRSHPNPKDLKATPTAILSDGAIEILTTTETQPAMLFLPAMGSDMVHMPSTCDARSRTCTLSFFVHSSSLSFSSLESTFFLINFFFFFLRLL